MSNIVIWLSSFFGPHAKLRMLIVRGTVRYFTILDRPIQDAFYSGPVCFGWKIFEHILMKFKKNQASSENKMCWKAITTLVHSLYETKTNNCLSGGKKKQDEEVTR